MKKSKKLSEGHLVLGALLVISLLGLSLVWFESGATGQAVQTKGITYQKEYTTKETTTQKTLTTKLPQSTQVQKAPLLREEPLSVAPSSETPVQRLPQPAPGDQDSDVELANQCTTCGKQYEYRMMEGLCGGTVEDWYSNRDPGLNLRCSRTDGYNDHRFTEGAYVFNMYATAKCEEPYNWIVSYGAECPWSATLTKIGPNTGAIVLDANSWSPMPLVGEVEANCMRISALPGEVDDAVMRIWITCMREKR